MQRCFFHDSPFTAVHSSTRANSVLLRSRAHGPHTRTKLHISLTSFLTHYHTLLTGPSASNPRTPPGLGSFANTSSLIIPGDVHVRAVSGFPLFVNLPTFHSQDQRLARPLDPCRDDLIRDKYVGSPWLLISTDPKPSSPAGFCYLTPHLTPCISEQEFRSNTRRLLGECQDAARNCPFESSYSRQSWRLGDDCSSVAVILDVMCLPCESIYSIEVHTVGMGRQYRYVRHCTSRHETTNVWSGC